MYIVLDIGGTHGRMALYQGKPNAGMVITRNLKNQLKLAVINIRNDYSKDLELLANKFAEWKQEFSSIGQGIELECGAAGVAGAFDVNNTKLTNSVNLSSWQGHDLVLDFGKIFGCKFICRNDTYMAMTGAIYLLRQSGDFWYLNWGTGIGGGLAIDLADASSYCPEANNDSDSQSWHYQIKPSEIGHASIAKDGISCRCGQRGCWDAYCSGRQLESKFAKELSELTLTEWRSVFADMAQGIVNLYVSYPAKTIILNGGVIQHEAEKVELLSELIRIKLKILPTPPKLVLLKNGEVAGLIGSWLIAAGVVPK